ncbi:MAG: hypothetical protein DI547_04785 [Sphingobium sp.]|nr:MAG: hypothetical protein DI547_04785 [Sphingobium sp.]
MTAAVRLDRMPFWPARMSEDLAALYLGVSKTTFRTRWVAKAYPQPIRDGRRLLWSLTQLNRFVDAQFNLTHASDGGDEVDESWADLK